jgi:exodeoxyribonuclease-3
MRIATQNLNWGGDPSAPGCNGLPRLQQLVMSLGKIDADILVLTEYKSGVLGDELKALLANSGYPHFVCQKQNRFVLGTAIESRRTMKVAELPIAQTTEPWRSVGASMDGVDVFGLYFPLKTKPAYWDWLLANARKLRDGHVILIGDFNTGKIQVDEVGKTFDCQEQHDALEAIGFVDTWRAAHPEMRDYTWYSSLKNGFRLDYIWASPSLAPGIKRVWLDHEPRLALHSDHSAVAADLSIPAVSSHV